MQEKLLELDHLYKIYGKGENQTYALNDLTCSVLKEEFLGIMGSSGSGKTTLLNCVATMMKPTRGRVLLSGKELSKQKGRELARYRGDRIGYLFQNFELLDNMTGRENILLPASIHGVKEDLSKEVERLAEYLEIGEILDKFPEQMSGGQKQRIAAARALVLHPDIVLADEPTGALDSKNAKQLMEKLKQLNEEQGTTIMMVTHDANAASYCSRILFIQDGGILHELRRNEEDRQEFYRRILSVQSQLLGGSANVF